MTQDITESSDGDPVFPGRSGWNHWDAGQRIAHDLNNILAPIMMLMASLIHYDTGNHGEDAEDY